MKKHVFSLMMMLAVIAMVSTSAMAQLGGTVNENESAVRYVMVAGSSHNFSITENSNSTAIAWSVYDETRTQALDAAQGALSNGTTATATLDWTNNSMGNYTVQVIETRNSCTTTRQFFITIIDFDVFIYAANADGSYADDAAELAYCGAGTTAAYGDVGTAGSADAFSNVYIANDGSNVLEPLQGDAPHTNRYIGIQIIWNLGAAGITAPTVGGMTFDWTAVLADTDGSLGYADNTDLVSVNGVAAGTADDDFIAFAGSDLNAFAAVADFGANTSKGPNAVLTVVTNSRWSGTEVEDLTLDFQATDVVLYTGTVSTALGTTVGAEPTSYATVATTDDTAVQQASNKANTQTIQLAPATSIISVTQN